MGSPLIKFSRYSLLFLFLLVSCNLFTLREPEGQGGNAQFLPVSFSGLVYSYKESIVAANINQYEDLLSDSFHFVVCDRIYHSNPDYYDKWDKQREISVMQNLFLSLSMNESYPVVFERYDIVLMDTTSSDSQYARVQYLVYFHYGNNSIDTASGYMDFYGIKENEFWQARLISDHEGNEPPCLSDIKIKFLSGK